MSENKKYYWLKLKRDFFTDKRIKKLRNIAGGDTYTIIYLKMQLLSLQDEGYLYFENVEDTFAEEIALEIDEDIENVKTVIAFLIRNNLLVEINKNIYELIETKMCIGSETRNAKSMRNLREKRKLEAIENDKNVTMLQSVTKCYTEKEKEKEKDIEIKKEKNIKKEKFGKYGRIKLTRKEYEKLIDEFGEDFINKQIELLDEYVESNNNKNKYSNFNLVLRKSIRDNWFNKKKEGSSSFLEIMKNEYDR